MQNDVRVYKYSTIRTAIPYALMVVAGVIFAGGIVLVKSLSDNGAISGNPWVLYAIFGIVFLGCVFIAKLNYEGSRPIAVTANEIAALSWNGQWRSIYWKDVSRIEKVRFYDPLYSQVRSSFIFVAPGKKIRFSDAVLEIRDLLAATNIRIREHHIHVCLRDSTRKTISLVVTQIEELDI